MTKINTFSGESWKSSGWVVEKVRTLRWGKWNWGSFMEKYAHLLSFTARPAAYASTNRIKKHSELSPPESTSSSVCAKLGKRKWEIVREVKNIVIQQGVAAYFLCSIPPRCCSGILSQHRERWLTSCSADAHSGEEGLSSSSSSSSSSSLKELGVWPRDSEVCEGAVLVWLKGVLLEFLAIPRT